MPDTSAAEARLARQILILAVAGGVLLRLLSVTLGDLDPGGDGLQRLAVAARWAANPEWQGLSGVWPPLHFYTLGALLRVWDEPMILARAVNLLLGVFSLLVFRAAVRPLHGELTAALATLILAFNWTHIWLTSSYWVEIPYLLLIFATIHQLQAAVDSAEAQPAWRAGIWLALAILLRHEGIILVFVICVWLMLQKRSWRQLLRFGLLPLGAAAWHWIEPWSRGGSYFDYATTYSQMKAAENLVHAFSISDRFRQILLMPASTPSVFVVLPGLAGLWLGRRMWRRDLFLWLFVVQVAFFLFLALTTGWRPQLRYILLYFVNLFPAAALVWGIWARRWRTWPVIIGLLVLTVTLQSVAWQIGRNEGRH
ncbi:MAG: ArnT family glycosyltransferase, partial [Acidobacteriota bacterium]